MKLHRRTAAWIAAGAVTLSLAGVGWRVTRPDYLRHEMLAQLGGVLSDGWAIEIDSVDYTALQGKAEIRGLRLLRTRPTRQVVVSVPRVEAEIRFAALLGRGRVASEVRIFDPDVLVERGEDGELLLARAFRAGGGESGIGAHGRVLVEGGVLRLKDPTFLAEGREIRFDITNLVLEESPDGRPALLSGRIEEGGKEPGGFGGVLLSGMVPPTKQGLSIGVERFTVDDAMKARLAPGIREALEPYQVSGPFGDEASRALDVVLERPDPNGKLDVRVTARPRGLDVHLRQFDYPFTQVRADITWNHGDKKFKGDSIELHHGPTTFLAKGEFDYSATDAPFAVYFSATSLTLDAALHDAFPENLRKIWDTYAFQGSVDIGAEFGSGTGAFKNFIKREKGGRIEVDIVAKLVNAGLSFKGPLGPEGVRHGFDWAVDRVIGEVSVKGPDGAEGTTAILLQGVRGRHGDTEVSAEGSVIEWPEHRSKVDITLKATDVPLDDSVKNCSPIITGLFEQFRPTGPLASLTVHIAQEPIPGSPTLATVIGEFDGRGGMTWEGMPLPVENIAGTVAYRERLLNGKKAVITEITGVKGTAGMGAQVSAHGTMEGVGKNAEIRLQVRADSILLDGALEDAVRKTKIGDAAHLWDQMRPSGPVDLVVDVTGRKDPRICFSAALRGAYLQGWGEVRFPVADLTGTVEVTPESVVLRSVRGMHDGREVTLGGEVQGLGDRPNFDLTLRTTGFPLDESARAILGPTLAERVSGYYATVRPAAGMVGDVEVRLRGPGSSLEPSVTVENLAGGAGMFDLKGLVFRGGKVRYADGSVALEDVVGAMGDRELRVPRGDLRLDRGEGTVAVEVRRLDFPGDLVGLIPADTAASLEEALPDRKIHFEDLRVSLAEGWRRIEMTGTVSLSPGKEGTVGGLGLEGTFLLDRFTLLRGAAAGDPTEVSGGMDFSRGAFDAGVKIRELAGRLDLEGAFGAGGRGIKGTLSGVGGRVEGRELRDAGGTMGLKGGEFLLTDFRGTLAGGGFAVSVGVGGEKRLYEGRVVLSNARARELFAPTDPSSEMRGLVSADLSFRKPRGAQPVLVGDGRVDIRDGKIMKVPVLEKLYGLFRQDPPVFTEGRMIFTLSGEKISFSEFGFDSSVATIRMGPGKSEVTLDGRLDLKLIPRWNSGLFPVDLGFDLIGLVWDRFKTVYVRGTIQRPEVFALFPEVFASGSKDDPFVRSLPDPAYSVERRAPWEF